MAIFTVVIMTYFSSCIDERCGDSVELQLRVFDPIKIKFGFDLVSPADQTRFTFAVLVRSRLRPMQSVCFLGFFSPKGHFEWDGHVFFG